MTTTSKDFVTFCVVSSCQKPLPCQSKCPMTPFSKATIQSVLVVVVVIDGKIYLLICHKTSRDHAITGSCHVLCNSFLSLIIVLSSLVALGLLEVEVLFFIFHVITYVHGMKRSHGFMYGDPLS